MAEMPGLKNFLRDGLDVLFVALNPPRQSHANGHWFSSPGSGFFKLLRKSGLITQDISQEVADDVVFGSTHINYLNMQFGVVDLIPHVVETDSRQVRVSLDHAVDLINAIHKHKPRTVCVIHSKVRRALFRSKLLNRDLRYDTDDLLLPGSDARFFLNYFPNGNNVPDEVKVEIFERLKRCL